MSRTAVVVGLGALLWLLWGAVRSATHWQVSANAYLASLVVAGIVLGALWPGPHLLTGVLLVVPGFVALVAVGPGDLRDYPWWLLTIVVGLYGAAGGHRLSVELRRRYLAGPGRRR